MKTFDRKYTLKYARELSNGGFFATLEHDLLIAEKADRKNLPLISRALKVAREEL